MIIKITNTSCGACRFIGMGEDADAYCSLYEKFWDMTEDECHEADPKKPEFCKAISVSVTESGTEKDK